MNKYYLEPFVNNYIKNMGFKKSYLDLRAYKIIIIIKMKIKL